MAKPLPFHGKLIACFAAGVLALLGCDVVDEVYAQVPKKPAQPKQVAPVANRAVPQNLAVQEQQLIALIQQLLAVLNQQGGGNGGQWWGHEHHGKGKGWQHHHHHGWNEQENTIIVVMINGAPVPLQVPANKNGNKQVAKKGQAAPQQKAKAGNGQPAVGPQPQLFPNVPAGERNVALKGKGKGKGQ